MSGGGTTRATLLLSGAGRNVEEALRQIEMMNSRELSTVNLTFLILGEGFARTDVGPVIDVFARHLHFKPNTLIAICKERALDFLKGFQTLEEVEPSQYLVKLVTTSHSSLGVCPLVTMHDFMVGFNTISIDPWAPYIGLVPSAPAEEAAGEKAEGSTGGDQSGGKQQEQGPLGAKKVVQLFGTAVFSKVGPVQRMVGSLDTWESMAALLMRGDLETGFLAMAYPGDQAETTLLIHHTRAGAHVTLDGDAVQVAFKVVATASISESAVDSELPEKQQDFRQAIVLTAQEQILSLLQRTFAKITALDSDVLGLGRSAQSSFPTYGEWEAFNWKAHFPDTVASFDVKVHIFTTGFTIEKPFPR